MIGKVSGSVKTQLIAHDKEVHDIAFTRAGGGRDLFASVGSDGSVRMFDLRLVNVGPFFLCPPCTSAGLCVPSFCQHNTVTIYVETWNTPLSFMKILSSFRC